MAIKNFLRFGIRVFIVVLIVTVMISPVARAGKVIRQVHPPPMMPPPRPPSWLMQQALFYKWKSADVMTALKAQGLEAADVKAGLTVGALAAKESTIFLIPSHGSDTGGVAASYESEEQLAEATNYYSSLNTAPEAPAWRIFRKDNILLLISGRVPEGKAREYEKALLQLK